ncbi:MAG: glycosyltransferase family 39 protein, partial [Anaerolineales bacterium]
MVNKPPQIDSVRNFLSRAWATLPGRWFWLLIGLGLVVYGQYVIYQRVPLGRTNPALEMWNEAFRLEIVNLEDVALALPFLLIGALIWGIFGSRQNKESENAPEWPSKSQFSWAYALPRLGLILLGTIYLFVQLARHQYHPLLFWLWLGILAWLSYLFWAWDRQAGTKLSLDLERSDLLWMASLFALTLIVGAFALTDIPNILIADEGSFWEAARAIALGEIHPAFFDFGVYTFPIASSIFQGFVMRLAGVSLWGWRFSSVLAAAAATIPLYLLGRIWFGRRVAIAAVLIMAANPYFLVYGRLGYNNAQALFPVILSLYLWIKALQKSSFFYLWLAGIAAGLGFYTYPAAWLAMLVIACSAILLWLRRKMTFRRLLTTAGVLILATVMLFGPRLAYGMSGEHSSSFAFKLLETTFTNAFYARAYYGEADLFHSTPPIEMAGIELYYEPWVYYEMLVRGLVRTVLVLFDPFIHQERFMLAPFTGVLTPGLFLIGLVIALRNWKGRRFQVLLLWTILGLVLFSVLSAFPPSSTHTVSVIPAFALLSALGLVAVVEQITGNLLPAVRDRLQPVLLTILLIVVVGVGWQTYFVEMPRRYPPTFEDIVSWIAWRTTDQPLTIVYVGNTESPHRVEYLVSTHMVPHTYVSIPQEDLDWQEMPPQSIVFFEGQPDGKNTFIPSPPPTFTNSATYTDPNQYVIGYAWANTDVDLQPAPPFPISNGKFPVTIILVALLLAIIITLLAILKIRVRSERLPEGSGLRMQAEISLRKPKEKETQRNMKTTLFRKHGGLEVLEYTDFPTPQPKPGEVLVKLKVAALNHMDVMVREGWPGLNLELPHINGADGAGEVVALGSPP